MKVTEKQSKRRPTEKTDVDSTYFVYQDSGLLGFQETDTTDH